MKNEKCENSTYYKAMEKILLNNALSCQEKVVLMQMVHRFSILVKSGLIENDGVFNIPGSLFEEQTNIKSQQIVRNIIPRLISKGLIDSMPKSYRRKGDDPACKYYTLKFNNILDL